MNQYICKYNVKPVMIVLVFEQRSLSQRIAYDQHKCKCIVVRFLEIIDITTVIYVYAFRNRNTIDRRSF